ncbi:MAG: 2OG-Fe(II) oxygenase [Pseudomonadota bacterium]
MAYLPVSQTSPFAFDIEALGRLGGELSDQHQSADPFPHTIIDDFFSPEMVRYCLDHFPSKLGDAGESYERDQERFKQSFQPDEMSSELRAMFYALNSLPFVRLVERITGIKGLIPDPYFLGGGFHETRNGGHLSMHADFNHHKPMNLERRVNVLIYLNKNWSDAYGGQLELWDQGMKSCVQSVVPEAGRCVIFNTTGESWHGHPKPVAHPEGIPRRSIALYYYTSTWDDDAQGKTTQFRRRPGTGDKTDWQVKTEETLREFLPPVLMRPTSKVIRRIFS